MDHHPVVRWIRCQSSFTSAPGELRPVASVRWKCEVFHAHEGRRAAVYISLLTIGLLLDHKAVKMIWNCVVSDDVRL